MEKFTYQDYLLNQEFNHHTENTARLVELFGTESEQREMKWIQYVHEKLGHIPETERVRRDELDRKYLPFLKFSAVNA